MNSLSVGKTGEDAALQYLLKQGYSIISRNYRTRYGEIDIIASIRDTIVFVEVKSRENTLYGEPYEAVTFRKKSHLKRAIQQYVSNNKLTSKLRCDVISILLHKEVIKELKHFENIEVFVL